jgi:hypothetical protein
MSRPTMSRQTSKTLIAAVTIVSFATLALAPSSALAWGRGFGIGFGIGALAGAAAASQPAPAPVYVERPRAVAPAQATRSTKADTSDKRSEKHHHKETHTAAAKEPVTRTMTPPPPVATNTKPANDPRDADLRKCLVKEYQPDNSVIFKDTCTQESASTAKPMPVMNNPPRVTQSIQLEPPSMAQDAPQQMDGP